MICGNVNYISQTIGTILVTHATYEVIVLDEYNVYNRDWLEFSKTNLQLRAGEIFELISDLTNRIYELHCFLAYPVSLPIPYIYFEQLVQSLKASPFLFPFFSIKGFYSLITNK